MDSYSNKFLTNIIEDTRFEAKVEIAINLLDILNDKIISRKTGLDINFIKNLREEKIYDIEY